jgi:CHAD domain-containing protein
LKAFLTLRKKLFITSPAISKEILNISYLIIDEAISEINEGKPNTELIVYNLRKRVKSLRALLKLLRKDLGEEFLKKNNFTLRDLNRRSAAIRNFSALIKVCEILKSEQIDLECSQALDLLQDRIQSDFNNIKSKTDYSSLFGYYKIQLEKYKGRLSHQEINSNRFSAVKYGLNKIYSEGRKFLTLSIDDPKTETLHDLRKSTKDLFYSLRSLIPLWEPVLSGYTKEIKLLSDILGELHDLFELKLYIQSLIDNPFDFSSVILFIESQSESLLNQCITLGKKIYAETDDQFTERLKKYYIGYRRDNLL